MTETFLFDELLAALRREGFSVGMDQSLRMHALLERYPETSREELKTLLCPIFATSAGEQERFHVAYDEFFTSPPPAAGGRKISRRITLAAMKLPEPPQPRKTVSWRRVLGIAMSIVAVAVAALVFWPGAGEKDAEAKLTPETLAAEQQVQPADPPPPPRTPWLLIAGTFAFVLFAAEVLRTLLRWLRQRAHRAQGRPFDWPVRDPHPTAPRLFADRRFFDTARLMKAREVGEVRRLDVPRSILSTIRALGDPSFEYRLDRRVTEYLFLVERKSERDHLAAYVHAMLEALARDGVLVEVFEHNGDPRHCWKAGSNVRVATADLVSRFPQHRLVIVGDAVALTDPVTGEALQSIPRLFPWRSRAILTTTAETRALVRFGAYFDVYALADNGLARLVERWQGDAPTAKRRTRERRRIVTDLPSSPDEIERELEPLIFRWLLRCAVHPTLHWDLTRELAPPLPAAEHEAALMTLVRLDWFRRGRIPEPERLALVTRLAEDEPEETAARASAMRVLAAAPPPPAGSMAARVFEIQQLAHQIWSARDEPAQLRPLVRKLQHYPPAQIARDGALMMLLQEAPGTVVAHSLPLPLRHFLFRRGIPAFGMKNFVALAALLPVMLFAGNAAQPEAAPQQVPKPATVVASQQLPETKTSEPPPVTATTASEVPVAIDTTPANGPVVASGNLPGNLSDDLTDDLPDLPKLISPARRTVVTIKDPKAAVTFRWAPPGNYRLQVLDGKGRKLHTARVRGTSASWRATRTSFAEWSLTTADGRTTKAIPFSVEVDYEISAVDSLTTPGASGNAARSFRTVEVILPVSCSPTEGKREVNLQLNPRETFESVELKVLNAKAFTVARLTPYDRASFTYNFVAAKPCEENTLEAKIRVTATIRLSLGAGNR